MSVLERVEREAADEFRRLIRAFTPRRSQRIFHSAGERLGDLPYGEDLAFMLYSLQLKHQEIVSDLVTAYRHCRFPTTAVLSRTVLEGSTSLTWAMAGKNKQEQRDRLFRIFVESMRERAGLIAKGDAVLTEAERSAVEVAEREGLDRLPNARQRMEATDRALERIGETAFLEGHYRHFRVASEFGHVGRMGSARIVVGPDGRPLILMQGQDLAGAMAVFQAAYHFCLAYQSTALLAGLDKDARWAARRYVELRPFTERVLESKRAPVS